jgi:hypothetical protein
VKKQNEFMNNKATINGLLDGISVLENNNTNEQPCNPSDRVYNDQEPYKLDIPFHDEICEFTKI